MNERQTAQEHLDYWIGVMRDPRGEGQSHSQMDALRAQARRELKHWRRQVRMEYRAAQGAKK